MNTVRGFHLCDHSIRGEGVIACDTQLPRFKNTKAPADLSAAIHAASGDGLGWHLAFRSVITPSLLRAFHTSRISERHFGERGPSYIVDARQDIRRIGRPLKCHGADAQIRNSMHCLQKGHLERFFRDIDRSVVDQLMTSNTGRPVAVSSILASLRKLLRCWLQFYPNRTLLHQPATQTFNRQVSPLSHRNRNRNRDWPNAPHLQDRERAHWQNDPQRGRSSKDDHHIR
jgi:hypothetical protein